MARIVSTLEFTQVVHVSPLPRDEFLLDHDADSVSTQPVLDSNGTFIGVVELTNPRIRGALECNQNSLEDNMLAVQLLPRISYVRAWAQQKRRYSTFFKSLFFMQARKSQILSRRYLMKNSLCADVPRKFLEARRIKKVVFSIRFWSFKTRAVRPAATLAFRTR